MAVVSDEEASGMDSLRWVFFLSCILFIPAVICADGFSVCTGEDLNN